jgi:hypothetical protein
VQFPKDNAEAWNQASRARYLEFDSVENAQLQSDAARKLMDKIGPSVALTNSAGGLRAILTALKTNNLAGIVMYENVGYVYPQGEGPEDRWACSVPSRFLSRSSRSSRSSRCRWSGATTSTRPATIELVQAGGAVCREGQ